MMSGVLSVPEMAGPSMPRRSRPVWRLSVWIVSTNQARSSSGDSW